MDEGIGMDSLDGENDSKEGLFLTAALHDPDVPFDPSADHRYTTHKLEFKRYDLLDRYTRDYTQYRKRRGTYRRPVVGVPEHRHQAPANQFWLPMRWWPGKMRRNSAHPLSPAPQRRTEGREERGVRTMEKK